MIRYILDTDHLSFLGREQEPLTTRVLSYPRDEIATTIVSAEEAVRGYLNLLRRANDDNRVYRYSRFHEFLLFLNRFNVLPFDDNAHRTFLSLRGQRHRIGSQDLKIASIAVTNNVCLLTRNVSDFSQVAHLHIEDWSQAP